MKKKTKPTKKKPAVKKKPAKKKAVVVRTGNTFFDQVHDVVRLIPKGRVTSYGAIAKALGAGKSSRLVGYAMNFSHGVQPPVPAQRVVNSIGLLTGRHHFTPPELMQKLLESEGVKVKNHKVVDFDNLFWNPMDEIGVE